MEVDEEGGGEYKIGKQTLCDYPSGCSLEKETHESLKGQGKGRCGLHCQDVKCACKCARVCADYYSIKTGITSTYQERTA